MAKGELESSRKYYPKFSVTISVFLTATVVFPHEKGFSVTIPPKIDGAGKDGIWQFTPALTVNDLPVFEG